MQTTAGSSQMQGAQEAMCEQPRVIRTWKGPRGPVIRTCKGRTQGAMCEQQPVICTHPFMCNLGSERQGAMCEQLCRE